MIGYKKISKLITSGFHKNDKFHEDCLLMILNLEKQMNNRVDKLEEQNASTKNDAKKKLDKILWSVVSTIALSLTTFILHTIGIV